MRKNFLFVAILALGAINFAEAQTVYFNGLGRAIVTNDHLKGLALDPDTINAKKDAVNSRRGTGGYTLLDLGINAQPNENLRASALLRVKNEFGGFYGQGSKLEFRQLRLDGILNKVVKYQIGDIDISNTPYTLYNFAEMYHDYEADIFAIRRSIVNYENFNFGENWRVQGANASTAVNFSKYLEKITFGGFAARTKRTNFSDIPDRVLMGGDLDVIQSKYGSIGFNYVKFMDLKNTASSPASNFSNDVYTGEYKLKYDVADKVGIALYGEVGQSSYSYDTARVTVKRYGSFKDQGFYDLGGSVKYIPFNIKLSASYRNVAAGYSSPTAQTRRIFDYGTPTLFPTIGNNVALDRIPNLFDRFTDENIRNLSITPFLMAYLPQYNNITPYGLATPNRKGLTIALSAGGADKVYTADLIYNNLSEIVGEGTVGDGNKRKFTGLKGGASIAINKIFKFERAVSINGGFRYENTERTNNAVSLKSTLVDAGLTAELVKQFDLLFGYKMLKAEGNEFLSLRNAFNEIVGYSNFEINSNQKITAFGVRYRFSRNTFFTAQGNFVNDANDLQKFSSYKMNQVFLNYTMVF